MAFNAKRRLHAGAVGLLGTWLAYGITPDPALNCPILSQQLVRNEKVVRDNTKFDVDRDFVYYTDQLGKSLVKKLRPEKGKTVHWVDLGAGNAFAMRTMFRPLFRTPPVETKSIRCTAVGFAEPNDLFFKMESQAIEKGFGKDAFRYLAGNFFHEISDAKIGMADVITDVFGVLSYSPDPSRDLRKALNLLNPDGILILQVIPEGFAFAGQTGEAGLLAYLKTVGGVEVTRAEHTLNAQRTKVKSMVIELKRTGKPLSVPDLEVVSLESKTPPHRTVRVKP